MASREELEAAGHTVVPLPPDENPGTFRYRSAPVRLLGRVLHRLDVAASAAIAATGVVVLTQRVPSDRFLSVVLPPDASHIPISETLNSLNQAAGEHPEHTGVVIAGLAAANLVFSSIRYAKGDHPLQFVRVKEPREVSRRRRATSKQPEPTVVAPEPQETPEPASQPQPGSAVGVHRTEPPQHSRPGSSVDFA